jgi:hypothetical protein
VPGDGPEAGRTEDLNRASELFRRRFAEYLAQWEEVSGKLRRSEYHAEDLVDDSFRLWGNSMRDATAVATILLQAADPRSWDRNRGRR